MENIIYDINTIDGHYIGKLIDTNIYEYHLSHAAPLFLKMPKQYSERISNNDAWIAWEYKWRDNILQTGLYNDTYVNSVRYENYLDIKQSLLSTKTDFDNSVEITVNLWDFFKRRGVKMIMKLPKL